MSVVHDKIVGIFDGMHEYLKSNYLRLTWLLKNGYTNEWLEKPFSCSQCNKTFIIGNKSYTDE